jgi:hypothetical protein
VRFVYHPEYVGVAYKEGGFSANMGGVGPGLPPAVLAFVSVGVQERYFVVWLYDDEGRTYTHRYDFADIPMQDGGPSHITRIDVTGNPIVVLHDQMVKVFFAMYRDGPEAEQLFRFNTGYRLEA